MKQSIFNSLLQFKDVILDSVDHQDTFMRDVVLNTSDDVGNSAGTYLMKTYNYTVTTMGDVAYSFSKNSNEAFTTITMVDKTLPHEYVAVADLSAQALDSTIDLIEDVEVNPMHINVNLGDIAEQANLGESMNTLMVNLNEKFLTSSNALTSELISVIDNSNAVNKTDAALIKQQILDSSLEGKVSNYAWLNILKNNVDFMHGEVESNDSIALDTTSPFALQSFLNTVFTILANVFSTIIQAILLALAGVLKIVGMIFVGLTSLVKLLGTDRVQPEHDATNDYVQGVVAANGDIAYNDSAKSGFRFDRYVKGLIDNKQMLRLQNGSLDYYIWKQNFQDADDSALNINCYASPTFYYPRFLLAMGYWFNYDVAHDQQVFRSSLIPNIDNLKSSSYSWYGDGSQFMHHLEKVMPGALTDPTHPAYIFLTPEEQFRCSVDEDFATYCLCTSLWAHNFLRTKCSTYGSVIKPDGALYFNNGLWNCNIASSSLSETPTNCLNAIITVINHALYGCFHGVSAFRFQEYNGSQLTEMCSLIRHMLQEMIWANNNSFIVNTDVQTCTTGNTRPGITGNFYFRGSPFLLDDQVITYQFGSGSRRYIMLDYTEVADDDILFLPKPTTLDQLPKKAAFKVPSFSTAEVITAMAIMATVVVAATVISNKISRALKAKRQVKLTARANKLNAAREIYNDNPDDPEAKAAYLSELKSYNRKASFFGWPSYDAANGWMNSSSDSSTAVSGTSLVDLVSTQLQSAENTEQSINGSLDDRASEILNTLRPSLV